MIGELGRRSSTALLLHSALIQAITFLVRPAATYRALELDVPAFALGVLAASYAVFPLLLALPIGNLVDRLGERRLMAAGSAITRASKLAPSGSAISDSATGGSSLNASCTGL